jgi:hypothetical protein
MNAEAYSIARIILGGKITHVKLNNGKAAAIKKPSPSISLALVGFPIISIEPASP